MRIPTKDLVSRFLPEFLCERMRGMTIVQKGQIIFAFGYYLCTEAVIFLKSVGLGFITFIRRQLSLSRKDPRQIVVTRSFLFALGRCFIHIIPLTISLFLIVINLRGYYIGQHLLGISSSNKADSVVLALIQVAAKHQVSERLQAFLQIFKAI